MGVKPNPWIVAAYWKCILLLNPPTPNASRCTPAPAPGHTAATKLNTETSGPKIQTLLFPTKYRNIRRINTVQVSARRHQQAWVQSTGTRKGFKAPIEKISKLTPKVVAPLPLIFGFDSIQSFVNSITHKNKTKESRQVREMVPNK